MNGRFNFLQQVLDNFTQVLSANGDQLQNVMQAFAALFLALAVVWFAYALVFRGSSAASAFGLVFRVAFVMWAIDNWPGVLYGLETLGVRLGLMAAGAQTLDTATILNPGSLLRVGIDAARPIYKAFQANAGLTSFVTGLAFFGLWVGFVSAYAVISYKFFYWQIEMLIATLGGMCLLPTLAFRPLSFVGSGTLSYAANMFVRWFLASVLAGGLWSYLGAATGAWWNPDGAPIPPLGSGATLDISIQEAFAATTTVWVFAWCFLAVNRLASMLVSGIPQLSGAGSLGALMRTLVGGASAGVAVGAAATTAFLGGARGLAAGAQAIAGGARALPYAAGLLSHGGTARLVEAARHVYAGASAGLSGGAQAHIGALMSRSAEVFAHSGAVSVRELMGAGRMLPPDQAHHGARY